MDSLKTRLEASQQLQRQSHHPHQLHWHWHERHVEGRTLGDRIADKAADFIGSWRFVIIQTLVFNAWVLFNVLTLFKGIQFDPYPFILFNLVMSAEAAYSSPLIMMSQNRQADRDRVHAQHDYEVNLRAKEEIETLQKELARIETSKLDAILEILRKQ